jgi:carbamoyltransferase
MGAALYVAHVLGDDPPVAHPSHDYLGPGYGDDEIEAILRTSGCAYTRPDDIAEAAADRLAQSMIVGWFQGRAEFGPRALGARSILADPRQHDAKEVLNARVKFREPFRPFAPVVVAERCGEFFAHDDPSPYMLLVYDTLPDKVDVLPAVTHVDGGARVQTVTHADNGPYYEVVKAFGERTGVPVLVNTSFNIRGEPIVTTVQDALKCFYTTDMDALAIGPFLLDKRA